MDKLKMQTPDNTQKNIEKIAALFPHAITETKDENGNIKKAIDFDLLKQSLSDILVEDNDERYRLDWPGKKESLLKANTPVFKTLRPVREESVNFDNTENLYIEGDNFEVLKILQESYLNKVKMIYIDPPYNTGNDFIYSDKFAQSKEEYEEELGVMNEEGGKLFKNTDTNGRFHSDWLSMMYERLIVARDLLKDDGVIFISIDDNEVHNLRKICDEIFGEDNFITEIAWRRSDNQANIGNFAKVKEYIICYCKSLLYFELNKMPLSEKARNEYRYQDKKGKFRRSILLDKTRGRHTYNVKTKSGNTLNGPWMIKKDAFMELDANDAIYWTSGGLEQPYGKIYLHESKGQIPNDFWGIEFGTNQRGSLEVEALFNKRHFDFPKPVSLIKTMVTLGSTNQDIILDFFSGSATTAHAVMQLNTEDGGNRKHIMVQLPEKTDETSEAYKAGYKTIAKIGRERIIRAGNKIKEEFLAKYQSELDKLNKDNKMDLDSNLSAQKKELEDKIQHIKNLDTGFRLYKTDTTNMKDVFYHPNSLKQEELKFSESNIKDDRTPEDLLTQVILDLGLELNLPIEKKEIYGNNVYFVQTNSLVACFDDNIDFRIVDDIADLKPLKAVFKDASFTDDKDRINLTERFKRLSPETIIKVL
jgi:adenine-specific DNA-methyltransferase